MNAGEPDNHMRGFSHRFFIFICLVFTHSGAVRKAEDGTNRNGAAAQRESNEEMSVWSPCSRTCGIGIKFRRKLCMRKNRELCIPQPREHATCNTQDCPSNSPDFRHVQCARYNDKQIVVSGAKGEWIPHYIGKEICRLYCHPVGQMLYYYFGRAKDGTQCADPYSVCVNAQCRPVGCDKVLESGVYEDKCGVCGGNNTKCRLHRGQISKQPTYSDRLSGYTTVLAIPKGATNVFVSETTRNYLAIKRKHGSYIINGNKIVVRPQTFEVGKMKLKYERSRDRINETLRIRGPTTEDLHVMARLLACLSIVLSYPALLDYVIQILLVASLPSCTFEYWLSKTNKEIQVFAASYEAKDTVRPTEWGPWTSCSVSCSSGIKVRARQCVGSLDAPCLDAKLQTAKCIERPCGPHWSKWSPWNSCSASCGVGAKIRFRRCKVSRISVRATCPGSKFEVDFCYAFECPMKETTTAEPLLRTSASTEESKIISKEPTDTSPTNTSGVKTSETQVEDQKYIYQSRRSFSASLKPSTVIAVGQRESPAVKQPLSSPIMKTSTQSSTDVNKQIVKETEYTGSTRQALNAILAEPSSTGIRVYTGIGLVTRSPRVNSGPLHGRVSSRSDTSSTDSQMHTLLERGNIVTSGMTMFVSRTVSAGSSSRNATSLEASRAYKSSHRPVASPSRSVHMQSLDITLKTSPGEVSTSSPGLEPIARMQSISKQTHHDSATSNGFSSSTYLSPDRGEATLTSPLSSQTTLPGYTGSIHSLISSTIDAPHPEVSAIVRNTTDTIPQSKLTQKQSPESSTITGSIGLPRFEKSISKQESHMATKTLTSTRMRAPYSIAVFSSDHEEATKWLKPSIPEEIPRSDSASTHSLFSSPATAEVPLILTSKDFAVPASTPVESSLHGKMLANHSSQFAHTSYYKNPSTSDLYDVATPAVPWLFTVSRILSSAEADTDKTTHPKQTAKFTTKAEEKTVGLTKMTLSPSIASGKGLLITAIVTREAMDVSTSKVQTRTSPNREEEAGVSILKTPSPEQVLVIVPANSAVSTSDSEVINQSSLLSPLRLSQTTSTPVTNISAALSVTPTKTIASYTIIEQDLKDVSITLQTSSQTASLMSMIAMNLTPTDSIPSKDLTSIGSESMLISRVHGATQLSETPSKYFNTSGSVASLGTTAMQIDDAKSTTTARNTKLFSEKNVSSSSRAPSFRLSSGRSIEKSIDQTSIAAASSIDSVHLVYGKPSSFLSSPVLRTIGSGKTFLIVTGVQSPTQLPKDRTQQSVTSMMETKLQQSSAAPIDSTLLVSTPIRHVHKINVANHTKQHEDRITKGTSETTLKLSMTIPSDTITSKVPVEDSYSTDVVAPYGEGPTKLKERLHSDGSGIIHSLVSVPATLDVTLTFTSYYKQPTTRLNIVATPAMYLLLTTSRMLSNAQTDKDKPTHPELTTKEQTYTTRIHTKVEEKTVRVTERILFPSPDPRKERSIMATATREVDLVTGVSINRIQTKRSAKGDEQTVVFATYASSASQVPASSVVYRQASLDASLTWTNKEFSPRESSVVVTSSDGTMLANRSWQLQQTSHSKEPTTTLNTVATPAGGFLTVSKVLSSVQADRYTTMHPASEEMTVGVTARILSPSSASSKGLSTTPVVPSAVDLAVGLSISKIQTNTSAKAEEQPGVFASNALSPGRQFPASTPVSGPASLDTSFILTRKEFASRTSVPVTSSSEGKMLANSSSYTSYSKQPTISLNTVATLAGGLLSISRILPSGQADRDKTTHPELTAKDQIYTTQIITKANERTVGLTKRTLSPSSDSSQRLSIMPAMSTMEVDPVNVLVTSSTGTSDSGVINQSALLSPVWLSQTTSTPVTDISTAFSNTPRRNIVSYAIADQHSKEVSISLRNSRQTALLVIVAAANLTTTESEQPTRRASESMPISRVHGTPHLTELTSVHVSSAGSIVSQARQSIKYVGTTAMQMDDVEYSTNTVQNTEMLKETIVSSLTPSSRAVALSFAVLSYHSPVATGLHKMIVSSRGTLGNFTENIKATTMPLKSSVFAMPRDASVSVGKPPKKATITSKVSSTSQGGHTGKIYSKTMTMTTVSPSIFLSRGYRSETGSKLTHGTSTIRLPDVIGFVSVSASYASHMFVRRFSIRQPTMEDASHSFLNENLFTEVKNASINTKATIPEIDFTSVQLPGAMENLVKSTKTSKSIPSPHFERLLRSGSMHAFTSVGPRSRYTKTPKDRDLVRLSVSSFEQRVPLHVTSSLHKIPAIVISSYVVDGVKEGDGAAVTSKHIASMSQVPTPRVKTDTERAPITTSQGLSLVVHDSAKDSSMTKTFFRPSMKAAFTPQDGSLSAPITFASTSMKISPANRSSFAAEYLRYLTTSIGLARVYPTNTGHAYNATMAPRSGDRFETAMSPRLTFEAKLSEHRVRKSKYPISYIMRSIVSADKDHEKVYLTTKAFLKSISPTVTTAMAFGAHISSTLSSASIGTGGGTGHSPKLLTSASEKGVRTSEYFPSTYGSLKSIEEEQTFTTIASYSSFIALIYGETSQDNDTRVSPSSTSYICSSAVMTNVVKPTHTVAVTSEVLLDTDTTTVENASSLIYDTTMAKEGTIGERSAPLYTTTSPQNSVTMPASTNIKPFETSANASGSVNHLATSIAMAPSTSLVVSVMETVGSVGAEGGARTNSTVALHSLPVKQGASTVVLYSSKVAIAIAPSIAKKTHAISGVSSSSVVSNDTSTVIPSPTTEECPPCKTSRGRKKMYCLSDYVIQIAVRYESVDDVTLDTIYYVRVKHTFKSEVTLTEKLKILVLYAKCRCPELRPRHDFLLMGYLSESQTEDRAMLVLDRQTYFQPWRSSMMSRLKALKDMPCPDKPTKASVHSSPRPVKSGTKRPPTETLTTEVFAEETSPTISTSRRGATYEPEAFTTLEPSILPPTGTTAAKCRPCRPSNKRNKSFCESDFVLRVQILKESYNTTSGERFYLVRIRDSFKHDLHLKVKEQIWVINNPPACKCPDFLLRKEYIIMGNLANHEEESRLEVGPRSFVRAWKGRMKKRLESLYGVC